jgi:hypothetical protein
MEETTLTSLLRLVEYDGLRRRVWILGQRCHHGATGAVVAMLACAGLIVEPVAKARPVVGSRPLVALVVAGGALMAHDWNDHTLWFKRGRGSQP